MPATSNTRKLPRKRKATNACANCKSLRKRCSRQLDYACANCVKNNLECVRNPDQDGRKRIPMKRRLESLEEDHALFIRLLRTLRHKNEYVDGLLDYIVDEKPSLNDIKQYMDRHIPEREIKKTPELQEIYGEPGKSGAPPSASAHRALNIARLCDIPPYRGRARPWTTVTDDDEFVSHLVSLYFTWNHLFFNWIDRDLFLRDLNSGRTDSPFCSPLLVNAILAEACPYSNYPESSATTGDITTKGQHFFDEAKSLLDAEEGNLSLTTVQAIAVMWTWSSVMGKDRLGWLYLVRACKAVPMLRASLEDPARTDLPEEVTSGALDHLEVGLFSVVMSCCISQHKAPQMEVPKCPRFPIHCKDDETWLPYPLQVDPVPAVHRNCIMNQRFRLAEISWHICQGLHLQDDRPPRADIEATINRAYEDLLRWMEDLPQCLQYDEDSVPEVLSLHMNYHNIIMTAYAFLKTPIPNAEPQTLASSVSARSKCITAAKAVNRLVTIYKDRWTFDRHASFDLQFLYVALFMLMGDLHDPSSHDAFLNLANILAFSGSRWLLTKGMFRQVQVATMQANETLSPAIMKLFKRFERRMWRPEDRRRFSSAYPNFAAALQQQSRGAIDDLEMDDFLETWNDFLSAAAGQEDTTASERE